MEDDRGHDCRRRFAESSEKRTSVGKGWSGWGRRSPGGGGEDSGTSVLRFREDGGNMHAFDESQKAAWSTAVTKQEIDTVSEGGQHGELRRERSCGEVEEHQQTVAGRRLGNVYRVRHTWEVLAGRCFASRAPEISKERNDRRGGGGG